MTETNLLQSLAYHEMRLVMAYMLWSFDLTLAEDSGDWFDQNSYIVWEKRPLNIKLTIVDRK
jgi:hypothetical protein